jgi:DNA-binding response OmpR family regulator
MKKILIADDDATILKLLEFTFKDCGFHVITVENERQFLDAAKAHRPDIIILDIMLGDKDGTQSYHKLLAEGFDRRVPVVFLSALAQDRPLTPPKPGRTYALLGKPFDPDALVKEVQELVNA